MKKKLAAFIICTLLSMVPIVLSFGILPRQVASIIAQFGPSCAENSWCAERLSSITVFAVLAWSAWGLYFIINYRWIRFGYVEKKIRILGAFVGTCALLSAHLYGVFMVLPAVLLMLYIHFKAPYSAHA
ncbi:hypothetical protein [Motiliproteus sp. MSK22-1]|uniref:hypothetical protein n=1 Tax=Motiliproteus sp. MSK22-1 TaxID=1897630 RepID=UPI000978A5E2|nr:hypothetical protein [Motiliproteus sp. MSK22-1]OMH33543.1 hypothetical protein BGP75_10930 [Motiliproteus sp. MSK22-1]